MRVFIICVLIIFPTIIFACKYDTPEFKNEPEFADQVYIVEARINDDSKNISIINTKSSHGLIKYCGTPNLKDKKFYLLTSTVDLDSLKRAYSLADGYFYELESAEKLISRIIENRSIFKKDENILFHFCAKDSDCVQVKNNCNLPEYINKNYKVKFEKVKKRLACFTQKSAKCITNICQ